MSPQSRLSAGKPAELSLRARRYLGADEEVTADTVTAVALLNCLIREVAGPGGQVRAAAGPALLIDLPATGRVLRVGLRRHSPAEPRPNGKAWLRDGLGAPVPLTWRRIAELVDAELAAQADAGASGASTGSALVAEVAASHAFVSAVLQRRRAGAAAGAPDLGPLPTASSYPPVQLAEYLASEQALVAGHRFHPAPKARSGPLADALRYAPEVHGAFRLHYLAVPPELVVEHEAHPGAAAQFDVLPGPDPAAPRRLAPDLPAGYRLLPVHPWQYRILHRGNEFPDALATGRLIDLGELGRRVHPTSSVRTITRDDGTGYLKLSLAVQITNCLRVNPAHELHAAIVVSRLLEPIRGELAALFPGTVVLAETASRTVALGDPTEPGEPGENLADQLGVIAREGLRGHLPPGVTPLLAAALVEPAPIRVVAAALPSPGAGRDGLIAWWDGYLDLLLPPVLHTFLAHGVVFEAHLQNVVVALPSRNEGLPGLLVLRDLEGVKLVGRQHRATLAGLPPRVRDHLGYSPQRGWNRVAYCLFVNHLSAVLATLADRDPGAERLLWYRLRAAIQRFRRDVGDAPQLRDVLAGLPLPAKTNLLTRWHRDADRDSGYQQLHLPLGLSRLDQP